METIPRLFLALAALSLLIATGLGAYAAHGLDHRLNPVSLSTFRTGVEYQFIHGLGLLAIAILIDRYPATPWLRASGWLLIAGTILFCGALYIAALDWLPGAGLAAPVGGICLLLAWLSVALGAIRLR